MKKLYFFSVLALFSTMAFAQHWQLRSTGETGAVMGIDYASSKIAWIVTDAGEVARTTDGGTTWIKAGTVGDAAFTVAAISDKIAIVATGPSGSNPGKIVKTTDGGTTWTQVYSKASAWFDFIDNIDANNIWALSDPIGGKFLIVKSTDGGATWAETANEPAASTGVTGLNSCYYRIGTKAWFGTAGSKSIYTTSTAPDGPWTTSNATATGVSSVAFSNAQTGLASLNLTGKFNRTTDGGATWTAVANSRPDTTWAMDYIPNSSNVWIASSTNIYHSTDNGDTWSKDELWTAVGTDSMIIRGVVSIKFNGDANVGLAGCGGGYIFQSQLSPSLPVELTSFTATQNGSKVSLNWNTATETNNKGFEVERKLNNGAYTSVAFKNGAGTTTNKTNYSFTDDLSGLNVTSVSYRLKQVDFDGTSTYSKEAAVEYTAPVSFNLSQNYPNPFNPATVISYQVPSNNFVSFKVYNTVGQLVTTLVNEIKTAGSYNVTFDASKLSSGTYFGVLKVGNGTDMMKTIKMSLIK